MTTTTTTGWTREALAAAPQTYFDAVDAMDVDAVLAHFAGDATLTVQTDHVTFTGADEIRRMGQLMHDAYGIGLAATQVGVMHRLLVYRVEPDAEIAALVNPELEWASDDKEVMEEGCLSLPAVAVEVERPVHVRVRAQDERGEPMLVEASGLEARVIQHEMDHLDGVLILDRASKDQRKEAFRTLREQEREAA